MAEHWFLSNPAAPALPNIPEGNTTHPEVLGISYPPGRTLLGLAWEPYVWGHISQFSSCFGCFWARCNTKLVNSPGPPRIWFFCPFSHVLGQTNLCVPFQSVSTILGRTRSGTLYSPYNTVLTRTCRFSPFLLVRSRFGSNEPVCALSNRFHRSRPNLSCYTVFTRSTWFSPELVVFAIFYMVGHVLGQINLCKCRFQAFP